MSGNEKIASSPRADLAHSGFYYSELGFSLMKKGNPPLWNPYVFCGVPLLGGLQTALYYPLRWFSLFMEEGRALNISFILHFFLGSFFMYILLRYYSLSPLSSSISGIIFSFSAIQVLHLYAGHDCDVWTMIWIPLIILFLDLTIHNANYRYPLCGGIALGLQILASHPQHVYYTIIAGGIYTLFNIEFKKKKKYYYFLIARISIFITAAFGLSAIQLFPSFEMLAHSSRMGGTALFWIGQNSLPPENLLTIFFPGFFGDIVSSPYLGRWYLWENCLYLGWGAVIFGTLAVYFPKTRRFFFSIAIVVFGLFMATGKYNPVFPYLARFFPGFSFFRGHAKFIYLYGFGLSILTGYGLEYLFGRPAQKKIRAFILVWLVICLILIISVFVLFPVDKTSPFWNKILSFSFREGERYEIRPSDFTANDFANAYMTMQNSIRTSLAFLVTMILGIFISIKNAKPGRIFLSIVICMDILAFGQRYLEKFELKDIVHSENVTTFLNKDESYFRTGEISAGLLNRNIYHRMCSVGGYAANILTRYSIFTNIAQGLSPEEIEFVLFLKGYSPLLNGLNLKYLLSPSFKRIDHPDFKIVYEDGIISIYENEKFLPRAYLVPEVITEISDVGVLNKMLSPGFDFLKCAIVESSREDFFPVNKVKSDSKGEVIISRYEPNEVEIKVCSEKDAFIVLADIFYPGWNVYIDGNKDKIYPTDYIFRGVNIPQGKHTVLFRYEPWSFRAGAIITILTITATFLILSL